MKINEDSMEILLRQSNQLTMATSNFNVHEMRVVLRCIESLQGDVNFNKSPYEIGKDNLGNFELTIPVKKLTVGEKPNYQVVKKALRSLTKKGLTVDIRDDKGNVSDEIYTTVYKRAK